MKEFVEVRVVIKMFDGNVLMVSGEFSGTDPWGDDCYNDEPLF